MKKYVKPEIDIIAFEAEDPILESGNRTFLPSPVFGGEDEIELG